MSIQSCTFIAHWNDCQLHCCKQWLSIGIFHIETKADYYSCMQIYSAEHTPIYLSSDDDHLSSYLWAYLQTCLAYHQNYIDSTRPGIYGKSKTRGKVMERQPCVTRIFHTYRKLARKLRKDLIITMFTSLLSTSLSLLLARRRQHNNDEDDYDAHLPVNISAY